MNDLSEKEQLDLMREWWAENGRYVIGGVVLGIAILFSWNQWRSGVAEAELDASLMYEAVMTSVGDGDADVAVAAAAELFDKHAGTIYAAQGRLAMARLYMEKGRDQDAANVLRELVEADSDSEVGMVGRLRLARVLLYQDKADEVVMLLKDNLDNALAPRYNEVLGDAYVALGQFADAQAAYIAVITDAQGSRTVDTNLVQLKINDLPALDEDPSAAADDQDVPPVEAGEPLTVEEPADPATDDQGTDSGDEAQQ